jgi:hypothetical protein
MLLEFSQGGDCRDVIRTLAVREAPTVVRRIVGWQRPARCA